MNRKLALIWTEAVLAVVIAALLPLPARTQSDIEKLYRTKCAACHAADGSGNTPAGKKFAVRDFQIGRAHV